MLRDSHEILRAVHRIRLVKVKGVGLVVEYPDQLRPLVLGGPDLERMDFDCLLEGHGEDELLVTVRFQEAATATEAVAVRVLVRLVQALALRPVQVGS